MENVPWHADVKDFAEALAKERGGSEYELACEHAHSCCVLLARATKFKREGQWYTWIDYEKFHDLVSPITGILLCSISIICYILKRLNNYCGLHV
jgi:tRNA wybutosine-synthesizing protein 1